jgi:hypothetical protein
MWSLPRCYKQHNLKHNTPAGVIYDGLVSPCSDVVSVEEVTATRPSPPEESNIINLPLFLVILPRAAESQEIFRQSSLAVAWLPLSSV